MKSHKREKRDDGKAEFRQRIKDLAATCESLRAGNAAVLKAVLQDITADLAEGSADDLDVLIGNVLVCCRAHLIKQKP